MSHNFVTKIGFKLDWDFIFFYLKKYKKKEINFLFFFFVNFLIKITEEKRGIFLEKNVVKKISEKTPNFVFSF